MGHSPERSFQLKQNAHINTYCLQRYGMPDSVFFREGKSAENQFFHAMVP